MLTYKGDVASHLINLEQRIDKQAYIEPLVNLFTRCLTDLLVTPCKRNVYKAIRMFTRRRLLIALSM
jgi:hypothetical protein